VAYIPSFPSRLALLAALWSCGHVLSANAAGSTDDAPSVSCDVTRPAILFNRWQEDWSVLSNPCVPDRPLDGLKYIPLGADPANYLSFGLNLRERFELNNAALFGLGSGRDDSYVIQRTEIHVDARFESHLQIFVQFEDARPFGKNTVSPVDRDVLDLEQAFVAYTSPLAGGEFKFRIGRQEMAFDLQRFVSVRDGPNVRQAFDAVWADWEFQKWRFIAYVTQPVQYRDDQPFDDTSNKHLTFSGVRVERHDIGPGDLSAYYSSYDRSNAQYLDATGPEHRDVFDVRYAGSRQHIDWDIESMLQAGHVGNDTIQAYTFAGFPGTPRVALQLDGASGDRHPGDGRIGTFNALFPNGYYFTLAGYTGYSNLIHLKPSLTLKPNSAVTVLAAIGFQWRETTADAVYQQGGVAVPNTAGHGDAWTGMYTQVRVDWKVNANVSAAIEAVHFEVGDSLRALGAHNADYIGVEGKFSW
jgi:uncharacterized membrane protein (UPF0127 family)